METYQNAGLGKSTDLGLIGEQAGILNAIVNVGRILNVQRFLMVMVLLQHHSK